MMTWDNKTLWFRGVLRFCEPSVLLDVDKTVSVLSRRNVVEEIIARKAGE
jgi:hypothetical protein